MTAGRPCGVTEWKKTDRTGDLGQHDHLQLKHLGQVLRSPHPLVPSSLHKAVKLEDSKGASHFCDYQEMSILGIILPI